MKTLIRKDLQSIRIPMRNALIMITLVWVMIYLLTVNLFVYPEVLVVPILMLTAFISYDLVAHLFHMEHSARVNERMKQLPISDKDLILSRYITSIILVITTFLLNFILFLLSVIIHGKGVFNFIFYMEAFSIGLHLVLFTISIYLATQYIFGYSFGVWAGRIAFLIWIFFMMIAPMLYWRFTLDIAEAPTIQSFLPMTSPVIVILAIVLVILSYFLCRKGYIRRKQGKSRAVPMLTIVFASLVMFIGIGLQVERSFSQDVEAKLMETKIERIEVDSFNINETEEEPMYRVLFNIELKGQDIDWSILEESIVTFTTSGAALEQTHLEEGSFSLLNAYGSFLREEYESPDNLRSEKNMWYANQAEGPVLLSEEEHELFIEEFDERDFQFILKSPWLKEKEMKLHWNR